MKKFIFSMSIGVLMCAPAFATNDILAKVTNGALSDHSKGVQILTEEEERQVKGGIRMNLSPQESYTVMNRYYNAFYELYLTEDEVRTHTAAIYGDERPNAQNYLDFKWITIVEPENEIVAFKATYDKYTGQYTTKVVAYNKRNKNVRNFIQTAPFFVKVNKAFGHYIPDLVGK
ncbi:hypothetical protein CCZ01_04085 [Helicobacter monodelphidis]|uniref:hypothetical protein n=1 Tax=Helicobacter sp. 15-1451 TaxID=2004995 RepID=UPI000DCCDBAB|nr:hypothetical protein [Helicobacter sp. 15-1451]RAX57999.1 hypothetical protein CCZ01_04085 [Helicobacter sp. 15-1451]